MANVYGRVMDTNDFFDMVVDCNDYTEMWEQFLENVADLAASDDSHGFTVFEDFIWNHGYADKITDVLYDAAKAFTNEQIIKANAGYDLI